MLATALVAVAFGAQAGDTARLIDVRSSGRIVRVGAFKPRQYLGDRRFRGGVRPIRRNAIAAFGQPDGRDRGGCENKWLRLRIRIVTADFGGGDACAPTAGIQHVEVLSRRWRTDRGLRVGDTLARARRLYPDAQSFRSLYGNIPMFREDWLLISEPSSVAGEDPGKLDRLSARVRRGKVVLLRVSPYGAGD